MLVSLVHFKQGLYLHRSLDLFIGINMVLGIVSPRTNAKMYSYDPSNLSEEELWWAQGSYIAHLAMWVY